MNQEQHNPSGTPVDPTPVPAAAVDPATVQSQPEHGRQDSTDDEFKLEVDADQPGDNVTTHAEDDDPLSHVGEFVDENQDGVDDRQQGVL